MYRILKAVGNRIRAARALGRARESSLRRLAAAPVHRILVVCYGNIYRSAMLARMLMDTLGDVIQVRSAGFHPASGRSAPEQHQRACLELGIDLRDHRSSVVSSADFEWADTIVLMDRHNWSALTAAGADPAKFVWAGLHGGRDIEIADPYGLEEAAALAVVRRLHDCGLMLIQSIRMNQTIAWSELPFPLEPSIRS